MTWDYPLLAGVGLLAGFVDAIAGGGGLITLPALLWAGLPPQLALGTNKLQSSCGTCLATWRYAQAGLLEGTPFWRGAGVTFVASVLGSITVYHTSPQFLRWIIPFLLIAIGVYLALRPELGLAARPAHMGLGMFSIAFGVLLGFYDGFFGPGTGSFWMTACMVLLGMDYRAATGYTKAMNLASNGGSLLVFAYLGSLHWGYGLVMAAGQLAGAQLGSRLVIREGARWVRPLLIALVFILALRLLWQAVSPILG
ncbi:MAG: TSUP family transporter [Verrucomicrobiales bacterium]|nr:TSUP family transporter [Verrucomicrobiales bacterium]